MKTNTMRKPRGNKRPGNVAGSYDRRATDLPHGAMVSPIEVADPYASAPAAMVQNHRGELQANPANRITVMRSIRSDPLARMHARGQVDEVQFLAGQRWQTAYERSQIGSARGIDPTREAVDGGRMAEPLTEARQKASRTIAQAEAALGREGAHLVRLMLGEGMFARDVAVIWGGTSDRAVDYVTRRLRECLDTLARAI